jgi:6-O-methylguanine DNA methyltransferase, DNA binding domain
VDEIIRKVPARKLITPTEIAAQIARKHNATIGCTLTSGISVWIAAHAAHEAELEGKKKITPYWRALKSGGELNPKFPGGVDNLKQRLEAEGHVITQKGTRYFVENCQDKLIKL